VLEHGACASTARGLSVLTGAPPNSLLAASVEAEHCVEPTLHYEPTVHSVPTVRCVPTAPCKVAAEEPSMRLETTVPESPTEEPFAHTAIARPGEREVMV
jgi:hypothetical protein